MLPTIRNGREAVTSATRRADKVLDSVLDRPVILMLLMCPIIADVIPGICQYYDGNADVSYLLTDSFLRLGKPSNLILFGPRGD